MTTPITPEELDKFEFLLPDMPMPVAVEIEVKKLITTLRAAWQERDRLHAHGIILDQRGEPFFVTGGKALIAMQEAARQAYEAGRQAGLEDAARTAEAWDAGNDPALGYSVALKVAEAIRARGDGDCK